MGNWDGLFGALFPSVSENNTENLDISAKSTRNCSSRAEKATKSDSYPNLKALEMVSSAKQINASLNTKYTNEHQVAKNIPANPSQKLNFYPSSWRFSR